MNTLTPELRREIERAGDLPVRIEDPETHIAYVILKEEVYRRIRELIPDEPSERLSHEHGELGSLNDLPEIPEGIQRSLDAFRRDLPELLKDRRLRGKWVAYHGDDRIGIARKQLPLLKKCVELGLEPEEFITDVIEPKPEEPEEVDFPSSWR
jgi:hypothetical protein